MKLMRKGGRRSRSARVLSWLVAVLLLMPAGACTPGRASPTEGSRSRAPSAPRVDARRAKQLALERYRQLFADKYLLDPVSAKHRPFPPLSEEAFTLVKEQGDAWQVSADPPAGFALETRVARDGSWVEILRVSYAPE